MPSYIFLEENPVDRLASTFQASIFILSLGSLLTLAVYLCKLSYSPIAVYVSIVLMSVVRSVTIASLYSYVRIR